MRLPYLPFGLVLLILSGLSFSAHAQDKLLPAIIPAPTSLQLKPGRFSWHEFSAIAAPTTSPLLSDVQDFYKLLVQLGVSDVKTGLNNLQFELDTLFHLNPEAYQVVIKPNLITIKARSEQGFLYGFNSVLQTMTMDSVDGTLYSPCLSIEDAPRFPYRGMHLDVCRHFFPVSFIKRYIDYLAMYKFNTFHWHLTEDQGWRIEIKQYPKLTEIGAWRAETLVGHYSQKPHTYDGIRYGGYYTQEEIRDVVAYATSKGVTIIPEIEMPGHALAALSAYPEFSCTGGPFTPATTWGVFDDVFCTRPETITFLCNVLDEVIDLFPGTYIHIGGDECPKTRWKVCPVCQQNRIDHGLADEHELQSWFIRQIEQHLHSRGRRLIGWDEILEGGLAPDATVMSWRGTSGGEEAARLGHHVIMTPGQPCYFDHYQSTLPGQPVAIGGHNPLESVHQWDPLPPGLESSAQNMILGGQGNVWTEYMLDERHVEYMVFPRLAALAEALWSDPDTTNYDDFLHRLNVHEQRWQAEGINYFRYYR